MATDERKDADDAFGGYRGMWRSAEDECRRLRARAVAAEQRVRELEQRLREVRAQESTAKSKLVTAVEALKGVISAYDAWSVNAYPADGGSRHATEAWFAEAQRVENAIEQARALSEIEQGDTK